MFNFTTQIVIERQKVLRRVASQRRRILYRTASFTRQTVARSMRSGGKKRVASSAGEPPRTHTKRLKQSINFAVDERAGEFVVGVATIFKNQYTKPIDKETVPQLLNEGGLARVVMPGGNTVLAHYKPRPFTSYEPTLEKMRTALATNIETIGLT